MTTQIVNGYYYATGRRKESSARVFLKEGTGKTTINNRSIEDYFGEGSLWAVQAVKAIKLLHQEGLFDIKVTVSGGGINGQSGAISLGVARALDLYAKKNSPEIIESESEEDEDSGDTDEKIEGPLGIERWHQTIRKAGLLTRDSRRVLRKKVGLVKARKAKQFSKR